MSLLNQMLHDLAHQKQATKVPPLLIPELVPKSKRNSPILLLALFVGICFFGIFFYTQVHKLSFKNQSLTKQESTIQEYSKSCELIDEEGQCISEYSSKMQMHAPAKKEKSKALPLKIEAQAQVNIPPIAQYDQIDTKPFTLISYIEPIVSPASRHYLIESPIAEALKKELIPQQNQTSVALVNKQYSPQTLEEWRDNQLNEAFDAIDKGFDEEAINLLQEILLKLPNSPEVRENLASLYLTYRNFNQAAEVVNEGLKYSPANMALITIKARIFLDQGNAAAAVNILRQHKPSITSYPDFYSTLAAALQLNGQILEAGSLYRSLIQVNPDDGRYWLGFAIALEHNKKMNQAIEAYTKASQNPDSEPTVREYAEQRLQYLQG